MAEVIRPVEIDETKYITEGGKLSKTKEMDQIINDARDLYYYLNGKGKTEEIAKSKVAEIKAHYATYQSWNNFVSALVAYVKFNGPQAILGDEYDQLLRVAGIPELRGNEAAIIDEDYIEGTPFTDKKKYAVAEKLLNMVFGVDKNGMKLDNSYVTLTAKEAKAILDKSLDENGNWKSSIIDNEDLAQLLNDVFSTVDEKVEDARIYLATEYKQSGYKFKLAHDNIVKYLQVYNFLKEAGLDKAEDVLGLIKVVCAPSTVKTPDGSRSIADVLMKTKSVDKKLGITYYKEKFESYDATVAGENTLVSSTDLTKYVKDLELLKSKLATGEHPAYTELLKVINEDTYVGTKEKPLLRDDEKLSKHDKKLLEELAIKKSKGITYNVYCDTEALALAEQNAEICKVWYKVIKGHEDFVGGLTLSETSKAKLLAKDEKEGDTTYSAHLVDLLCTIERTRAYYGGKEEFAEVFKAVDKVEKELAEYRASAVAFGKPENELVAEISAKQEELYNRLRALNRDLTKLESDAKLGVIGKFINKNISGIKDEQLPWYEQVVDHLVSFGGWYALAAGVGAAVFGGLTLGTVSVINGNEFIMTEASTIAAIAGGSTGVVGGGYQVAAVTVPGLKAIRGACLINYNLHQASKTLEKVMYLEQKVAELMVKIEESTKPSEVAKYRKQYSKKLDEIDKLNTVATQQIGYAQEHLSKYPSAKVQPGARSFGERITYLSGIQHDTELMNKVFKGEIEYVELDGERIKVNTGIYTGTTMVELIDKEGKEKVQERELTAEELATIDKAETESAKVVVKRVLSKETYDDPAM